QAAASRIADQARVAGNATAGDGGGILVEGSALTIEGSAAVTGNSGRNGGGVAVTGSGASLTLGGSAAISGNTASAAGGGAWSAPGRAEVDSTLTASNVSGNTAATCAGYFHAQTGQCLVGGGGTGALTWTAQTPFGSQGTNDDQFEGPYGITLANGGLEMYVADYTAKKIKIWTRASASAAWQAQTPLTAPYAPWNVALSDNGLELFEDDSYGFNTSPSNPRGRVRTWTRASTSSAWQQQTPIGSAPGDGNDGFKTPDGMAMTGDGLELYVADSYGHRVSVWTRTSTAATWQAQTPLGNGSGSANNQIASPRGLALAPGGLELFVVDRSNSRVSVWTRANASAAWQWSVLIGNGEGAGNDQFNKPRGIALSSDGLKMFVGDTSNNRVARWSRASAAAAWEALTPLGSGSGTASDQFNKPQYLALSPDDTELYVSDWLNYRIAVWKAS
ncbi:MAG: NHL repeat-containing protein, partial [Chloroflexota bacterium]